MDPVLWPILGAIAAAAISGFALVRSNRPNAVATATATLVAAQAAALVRLDGQVAARDAVITDLRTDIEKCHLDRASLAIEVERQGHLLEAQGVELVRLRARVTELGDERIP